MHLIARIQIFIQLATAQMIHRSQGLSIDEMAFDPSGINKHRLLYIVLSRIRLKEKLYLLNPLLISNFQIDKLICIEMEKLTNSAK